uniref:Uncharacterized protein n=1 Tax=Anguilla anguilla TaxID=7936 RepID=A0A0E9PS78_ANGAN
MSDFVFQLIKIALFM